MCDTVEKAVREAKNSFPVDIVKPEAIYDVGCDIYAPCSVGQTINLDTVGRLKCKIIAGAVNNQLCDCQIYKALQRRGILYCPDFVLNAGGIICVGGEFTEGGWTQSWVEERVAGIYTSIGRILDESRERGMFTEAVALEIARDRIRAVNEKNRYLI